MRSGQVPEAITEFQKTLTLNPDNIAALNGLGVSLTVSNRCPEAVDVFRLAVRLQPNSAEAHDYLGNTLSRSGKVSEAIEQYRQLPNSIRTIAEGSLPVGTSFR